MRVIVGSDHAAFKVKQALLESLMKEHPELAIEDLGSHSEDSVDYPDFAEAVARKVAEDCSALGVLLCGSGIGMAIAANKVRGARAANVWDVTGARLSRQHNNANIVCVGARLTGQTVILEAVKTFLSTEFLSGRHEKRVGLITKLEGKGS